MHSFPKTGILKKHLKTNFFYNSKMNFYKTQAGIYLKQANKITCSIILKTIYVYVCTHALTYTTTKACIYNQC